MKKRKIHGLVLLASLLVMTGCTKEGTIDNSTDILYANNENSDDIEATEVEMSYTVENTERLCEEEKITVASKEETYNINIKMVGDCLIHSPLYKAAYQSDGTYNFDMLFENVKDDIEAADLAIINQETIFVADNKNISSYPMFGSPSSVGDAEVKVGFDIICHATNHTVDKGVQSVIDTANFWESNYPDITYLGIHKDANDSDIKYITKNNIKLAFVNYTYGLNGLESRRNGYEYSIDMLTDSDVDSTIQEASNNSDMTIAILHVGTEYVYKPTDYAQQQVDRCIDDGADIVICAHPHVIEPYELRTTAKGNTGVAFYSLGNFVSNQDQLPRLLGGMADINITKTVNDNESETKVNNFTMIPLVTHQERSYFTTYKLEDYNNELASRQKIGGVTVEKLQSLWNDIIN